MLHVHRVLILLSIAMPLFAAGNSPCFPECTKTKAESGLFKSHGTAYALLVGLNYYQFEKNPRRDSLREAVSDVKNIMSVLQENNYCVDTLIGSKATPAEVRSRLSRIVHAADKNDRVLFYFAGHGMPRDSLEAQLRDEEQNFLLGPRNDKNLFYLVLYQTEKDTIIRDVISLGEIADSMTVESAIMQKVMIIDACYSGYGNPPVIAPFNAYNHLLSDNGYYSLLTWNDKVKEGLYTNAIYDALRGAADKPRRGNNDGKVDVFELSRYVDSAVGSSIKINGESYRAISVFIGSGSIYLTKRK